MNFSHIDTSLARIWDHGWFDTSRFSVLEINGDSPVAILSEFTASSHFARSFCESHDPWGKAIDRHGPFLLDHFKCEWYTEIPVAKLQSTLHETIQSYDFEPKLNDEQTATIDNWANSATFSPQGGLVANMCGRLKTCHKANLHSLYSQCRISVQTFDKW